MGDPREVELVPAGLPGPAREAAPFLREQAAADLRVLRVLA
ncbi:hypothetical protein SAMN05421874_12198 [Nonomuraea maritima]|uniref:Uncharacterized protein n=1 Tax=Nonomuraea maritima TaxID=683260 RepID=A0A1G9K2F3_9ACTN|nr:hypothetical protein [Nonomuraea maritima]SDL43525.1 hypothetical protein SAMN05421874_12198 [Nonomuraea maritima]